MAGSIPLATICCMVSSPIVNGISSSSMVGGGCGILWVPSGLIVASSDMIVWLLYFVTGSACSLCCWTLVCRTVCTRSIVSAVSRRLLREWNAVCGVNAVAFAVVFVSNTGVVSRLDGWRNQISPYINLLFVRMCQLMPTQLSWRGNGEMKRQSQIHQRPVVSATATPCVCARHRKPSLDFLASLWAVDWVPRVVIRDAGRTTVLYNSARYRYSIHQY